MLRCKISLHCSGFKFFDIFLKLYAVYESGVSDYQYIRLMDLGSIEDFHFTVIKPLPPDISKFYNK